MMARGFGIWGALVLAFALAAAPAAAQSSHPRLTGDQRREITAAAASAYADFYVFADRGAAIAAHLRAEARRGAFDRIGDPQAFAAALTAAIRAVEPDRHIEVIAPRAAGTAAPAPAPVERYAWLDRLRSRNYDFIRAERLPGNVGFLKLNSFPPPEVAGETAAAAMAFLGNCDALIIDLRENSGGTGDMVRFLASYFFPTQTRLGRTFRRAGNPQITNDLTLTAVPGRRMPTIDIFILTSDRTFSAAEAFAFALQQHDRAEVVGETTGGGGNAGDYLDIGHGFRAFVPDVHVMAPYGDASWERTGVRPNISAPAAEALTVAHREAVGRLIAKATDEAARERLRTALAAELD